ncbi:hypothetical protein B9G79_16595 [Bdellovibrio bacteriovorus]|uniref:Uncharacterized protein n=2 Tax=Bdellovibrio bacteriovorus TaxID=959 RepID=A0A1Z3NC69_BDEBC|nr:hypothetical protein B9G79_16595 [Bdellovibrio bacteriovorus]
MEATAFRTPLSGISLNKEAESYLKEIIQNLPQDLSPDRPGYYSHETKDLLLKDASERLALYLRGCPEPINFEDLRSGWNAVIVDYHRQNNWNYPTQPQKPEKKITQDQKIFKELFSYVWMMMRSLILLKTVVYYYGMHTATDPGTYHTVMLYGALLLLLANMVHFIWKKSRNSSADKN